MLRMNCTHADRLVRNHILHRVTGNHMGHGQQEDRRVGTNPIHNRRVISNNSGFCSSSTVTIFGSSAMPHLGQAPGSDCTTSGCIGQTYSVLVGIGVSEAGSSAMPHLGQGTWVSSSTSGTHGTHILRPRDSRCRRSDPFRGRRIEILQRVGAKFVQATLATE